MAVEISQVLAYPKFEKIYRSKIRREDLVEQVLKVAKFVEVKNEDQVIKEHLADNKFLECALAAKAGYVVSGDKHLLKVISFKQIRILSISDFLELLE